MNENEKESQMKGNRIYKDTVFRMLFRNKRELLSLYNAMNGSDYTDPDILEIVTLDNAVYMNVKNDLAFLADFHLYLYEHQSTVNPNMPLRFLQYVAREYEKLFHDDSLYSSKRVMIPAPQFVVFYNGLAHLPEQSELKLSKSYIGKAVEPQLELKVRVLNINEGNNEELKKQCGILKEYMQYVDCVRNKAEEVPIAEAVNLAVDECIRKGILAEFLQKNKSEVVPMSIFEYDEEKTLKIIRRDERELGREEGRAEGIAKTIRLTIESLAEVGLSKQDTAAKIKEKFGLDETKAQKYMDEHWKQ